MDHYRTLGVSPGDSAAEIRRAYLAEARASHPDFHAHAAPEARAEHARRMQALNDAWAVLGDDAARAAYDLGRRKAGDPGVARRAAREPGRPPPGKGWTPRAGDTGWMDDFDGWALESDRLAPEQERSASRRVLTLLPVGLFAAAVGCFVMGGIWMARPMLALGAVALVLSMGLFFLLPILEMRGSRRS